SLSDKKQESAMGNEEENQSNVVTMSDELEEVVFVLQKDGTVKKAVVKSGIQDINYIEILSGLSGGEEVVIGPYNAVSKTLKDGSKVNVVPKEKLFEKK
ncbi:MAG TPA: efflux transporter periplasmic adaptor subunit, partial [Chitinophagaceae bacterium]|nr:efflux transporter periplasmic adaptor subunit [Chitinophagaceae bacterium]